MHEENRKPKGNKYIFYIKTLILNYLIKLCLKTKCQFPLLKWRVEGRSDEMEG
jgi:hypothetical protein